MRVVWVFVLVMLLWGCAAPPVPNDRFYRLHLTGEAPPSATPVSGTLVVQAPRVDGIHNERAIIYSDDPGHRELKQYHYVFWMASPSQLVQDYLVDFLRRAGAASRVARDYGDGFRDHVVTGYLTGFEQLVDGDRLAAAVDLELVVTWPGKDEATFSRRYTEKVAVAGESMADTVRAFEDALGKIATAFAADLAGLAHAEGGG